MAKKYKKIKNKKEIKKTILNTCLVVPVCVKFNCFCIILPAIGHYIHRWY